MAIVTEVLAQSQIENAQILLMYDDAHAGTEGDPFVGTAVEVSVGAEAAGPCTVTAVLKDGTVMSQVVQPNQFNQIFSIPVPKRPKGVTQTTRFGTQTIAWDFQSVGMSF